MLTLSAVGRFAEKVLVSALVANDPRIATGVGQVIETQEARLDLGPELVAGNVHKITECRFCSVAEVDAEQLAKLVVALGIQINRRAGVVLDLEGVASGIVNVRYRGRAPGVNRATGLMPN